MREGGSEGVCVLVTVEIMKLDSFEVPAPLHAVNTKTEYEHRMIMTCSRKFYI